MREKGRDLTQSIIKTPPKTLITQRLWTDLGRSVGVTAVTPLVYLNRFTSECSTLPLTANSRVIKRTQNQKNLSRFVSTPLYSDYSYLSKSHTSMKSMVYKDIDRLLRVKIHKINEEAKEVQRQKHVSNQNQHRYQCWWIGPKKTLDRRTLHTYLLTTWIFQNTQSFINSIFRSWNCKYKESTISNISFLIQPI